MGDRDIRDPDRQEEGSWQTSEESEVEVLQLEKGQASEEALELEVEEAALAERAESDYHRREEVEDRLAHRSTALRPTGTQIHVDLFCHVEQVTSTCYGAACDACVIKKKNCAPTEWSLPPVSPLLSSVPCTPSSSVSVPQVSFSAPFSPLSCA